MARRTASPWKFYEVTWHDATSENAWVGHDALPDVSVFVTRGWLVRKTTRCLTLAATITGEATAKSDVGEVITIPRGCVVSMKELNV
jgi:hypothetical protein